MGFLDRRLSKKTAEARARLARVGPKKAGDTRTVIRETSKGWWYAVEEWRDLGYWLIVKTDGPFLTRTYARDAGYEARLAIDQVIGDSKVPWEEV